VAARSSSSRLGAVLVVGTDSILRLPAVRIVRPVGGVGWGSGRTASLEASETPVMARQENKDGEKLQTAHPHQRNQGDLGDVTKRGE
jgi:hypothetical protein